MSVLKPDASARRLRLTLEVDYDLHGETMESMNQNLERLVEMAVGEGLLSGGTDAEVAQYGFEVDEVNEETKKGAQARKPKRPSKKR